MDGLVGAALAKVWAKKNLAPFLPVFTVSPVSGKAMYGPQTPGTTTVGIQEAINAAVAAGGGRVFLFNGTYTLASDTNVGCSTNVPASSPPSSFVPLEIIGESALATTPLFAGTPSNGVIIVASPGGTRMVGIVDFFGANVALKIENIVVTQPVSTTMWHGFDVSGVRNGAAALVRNCLATQNTYTASAPTSHGTGTSADRFNAGFKGSNNFFGIYENCVTIGYNVGFRGSAQSTYIGCGAGYCGSFFYVQGTSGNLGPVDHPVRFYGCTASACQYVVNNNGNVTVQVTGELSIEYTTAAGNFQFLSFAYDPSNLIYGDLFLTGHASGQSTPNTTPIPLATLNNNGASHLNIRQVGTDEKPWLVDVNVFPTAASQVGWDTLTNDSLCIYGGYKAADSATPTTNEIDFTLVLAAGTWAIRVMYVKGASAGILSVQIDGTEVGTIDTYAAAVTRNQRSAITGVAVTTGGKHTLAIKVPTKNASSAGYAGYLQHITLQRTA